MVRPRGTARGKVTAFTAVWCAVAAAAGCHLDWESFKPHGDATVADEAITGIDAIESAPGDGFDRADGGRDGDDDADASVDASVDAAREAGCGMSFVVPDASCVEGVLPDPSFESDSDTWGGYENVDLERVPIACAPHGARVLRVTDQVNSASEWGATVVGPTTTADGQRYAFSAWIRVPPGSPRITNAEVVLLDRMPASGTLMRCGPGGSGGVLTLEPGVWTLTRVPPTTGTRGCRMDVTFVVRRSGAPPGAAIEFDDVTLCRVP